MARHRILPERSVVRCPWCGRQLWLATTAAGRQYMKCGGECSYYNRLDGTWKHGEPVKESEDENEHWAL